MLKQGYSDPQLYDSGGDLEKEWYVGFRFTCPIRQKRKPVQVRLGINYFKTVREREKEARAVISLIKETLDQGWNPFDCNIETYLKTVQPAPQPKPEQVVLKTPDGIEIPTPASGLAEALQRSYEIKKGELKPKTRNNYETGLRYAIPAAKALNIDKLPLEKVKRLHIRTLLDQIAKDRQAEYDLEGKGKTWTTNAFNRYKSYISAFFDTLLGYDAIEFNPCDKIEDKDPVDFATHRHATDEETELIKAHLEKTHPELRNLLRFEYVTGMRPNEILRTRYEMVDWLNSVIKFSYTDGKTKVLRLVPVPSFLLEWIRERQGNQPATNYLFGRKLKSGPRSLTTNNLSRLWHRYVKVGLGIDVSLYSFKGQGGDAKRDAGIELKSVSVGWGHTSVNTSKIYLKKEGERMRKQIIANAPDF